MNKEISTRTLINIKVCLYRIFKAEDVYDYADYRKVAANERAIEHYLKDYSEEQKQELLSVINWNDDNCSLKLKKLGWKIIKRRDV